MSFQIGSAGQSAARHGTCLDRDCPALSVIRSGGRPMLRCMRPNAFAQFRSALHNRSASPVRRPTSLKNRATTPVLQCFRRARSRPDCNARHSSASAASASPRAFVDNAVNHGSNPGRAHWNPIRTDRSLLHVGGWFFDEALSSAATTLTRSTVIGGRFNGAVRVTTGELLGGRSTTGYGAELGGYVGGAPIVEAMIRRWWSKASRRSAAPQVWMMPPLTFA